jgi:membrane associated rhomboid family serine protease
LLIPVIVGLVVLLFTGFFIRIFGGYTECDRTDCGPVDPALTVGMQVVLGGLVALILFFVVTRVRDLRRSRER